MNRIQHLTKQALTLIFILCAGLLLAGCGPSAGDSAANSSNANTAASNTGPAKSGGETTTTTTTASTNGGDRIGVAACDEYLEKYEACLKDKVPAAAQAQFKASLDTMRKSWKDAAANPQTRAGLTQGCQAALNAAKQSMASYNCNW